MRRALGRRLATAVVALLLVAGTVVGPDATRAAAAPGAPEAGIDPYQPYEPQTECDPSAEPGVVEFAALLLEAYPNTGWSGIERACHIRGRSEHKEGRAFDWAVSVDNPEQRAAAEDALTKLMATDEHGNEHALFRRFGLMYVIWDRRVFRSYRPDEGWQPYPCSPDAAYDDCHVRHVHFSFSRAGAERRTSWWTAPAAATQPAAPQPGADAAVVERIGGARQVDTAVRVSRRAFPTEGSAEHVFVAAARAPHDAIVAATLAGAHHGSLLLTGAADGIEPMVDAEINRLLGDERDRQVVFVGGPTALPEDLLAAYRDRYAVARIGGGDPYATARQAATIIEQRSDLGTAVVVSRSAYADALPIVAVAAANDWPILFTGRDRLHPRTRRFLADHDIAQVHVVGPTADISGAVVDEIAALPGVSVERHAGDGPGATSVAIAERFFSYPLSYAVATAIDWSDAVVGAHYAGERRHAPVLLTDGTTLDDDVAAYIEETRQPDAQGIVLGGRGAIGDEVGHQLRRSLR
jgi:putative cell wall-binding protein